MIHIFLDILLICASFFGIYLATRLITEKRKEPFYVLWLTSSSLLFLWFLLVKTGYFDESPIIYRLFQPIFFIGPACLYLHFKRKMGRDIHLYDYVLHIIPFLVACATTLRVFLFQQPQFKRQIVHFQHQINDAHYINQTIPFYPEAVMHVIRIGLTILYISIITVQLRKFGDARLTEVWNRIFLPVRISALLLVSTFVTPIVFKLGFEWSYPEYYVIVPSILVATFMFFWHVLMSIRALSVSVTSDENPSTETIDKPQNTIQTDIIANIPENLLAAITSIYADKLYLNPMFGISDIAEKHGFDNQKFSLEFNKHLPFTFTSYVNYLRLNYHIAHANDKFSVEANILTAGFNSRASYYQWIKRKDKLDSVLAPYVTVIASTIKEE